MRLYPEYTIAIAYLVGALVPLYGFGLVYRPNLYVKGAVLLTGYIFIYFALSAARPEGFQAGGDKPVCPDCGTKWPCPAHTGSDVSPICPAMPDMSKYVLKSSIPPCPSMPDMENYMLKSECPPVPDMSQYVLKSSIPKQGPIIIDTSAENKAKCGECPPCPRPRCPEVKCPAPTVCPSCPPCPRPVCPQQVVKCRSEEAGGSPVRPYLSPLGVPGFGRS